MNRTDDINATLRSLDVADHHVDPANPRARTDLHAILATEPPPFHHHTPAPASTGVTGPRRGARTTRRVVMVGSAAAALTAGLVALPSLTGGDQAFATWTPTPAGISAQQRPEAAAECRKSLDDAGSQYAQDLDNAEAAIAERRGVWTAVVLGGTDGFSGLCITDDSANLFADNMIGSIGTPTEYIAPQPRELTATDLGVGTMSAGNISLAAGNAGSDIVDVAYRSPTHGEVTATVSQGHFAFWLPGDELEDAATNGVDVEVTYSDGTTDTSRLTL